MKTCNIAVSMNVASGNKILWLRANAGISLSGVGVTHWLDQSGNNNHFTQNTAANQFTFVPQGVQYVKTPAVLPTLAADNTRYMTSDTNLNVVPPYTVLFCGRTTSAPDNHQDYIATLGNLNFSCDSVLIGFRHDATVFQPFNAAPASSGADDWDNSVLIIVGMVVLPAGFVRSFHAAIAVGSPIAGIADFGIGPNGDSGIHVLGSNSFPVGGGDVPTAYRGHWVELIVFNTPFGYNGVTWTPADLQLEISRLQNAYA